MSKKESHLCLQVHLISPDELPCSLPTMPPTSLLTPPRRSLWEQASVPTPLVSSCPLLSLLSETIPSPGYDPSRPGGVLLPALAAAPPPPGRPLRIALPFQCTCFFCNRKCLENATQVSTPCIPCPRPPSKCSLCMEHTRCSLFSAIQTHTPAASPIPARTARMLL